MRLSSIAIILGTFVTAFALSLLAAFFSVQLIEKASKTAVVEQLDRDGLTWAEVETDGLQVFLIGTAPDEARRFLALRAAGSVVDASRVLDQMLVTEPDALAPPTFSIELLRNSAGISAIGLVPATTDRESLIQRFRRMTEKGPSSVTDLLESADFPPPAGWDEALRFAVAATGMLPRSKISVEPDRVVVTAMAESEEALRTLETELVRRAPQGIALELSLSAPRPVITPFTLRFAIDEEGAKFDACSADTIAAREAILDTAREAGLSGEAECRIGLGVPSRRWAEAAQSVIKALDDMGQGTVTITNADISLVAAEGTPQETFDSVIARLTDELPTVFALNSVLTIAPDLTDRGPLSFAVSFDTDGGAALSGWLASDLGHQTAVSFARAQFTSDAVTSTVNIEPNLPMGWQLHALSGMHALSLLSSGSMELSAEQMVLTGLTGSTETSAEVTALLDAELRGTLPYEIDVTYLEELDPLLAIPTPEDCVAQIVEIIGERKITFEPSSSTLDTSAEEILDELAELLTLCGEMPLEIGGHTDSQGREIMNQALSRNRAQAVLDALRDRRVPVRGYTVVGYGESQPIADNGSEEGREANRRIEFHLVQPDPEEGETGEDEGTEDAQAQTQEPQSSSEGTANE